MLIITQDIVKASVICLHQRTKSKREVARLVAGEANLAIRVIFLFAVESLTVLVVVVDVVVVEVVVTTRAPLG